MSRAAQFDFTYAVVRSRRSTTDIVLERDGRLLVRAPVNASDERIARIVASRRRWIYRNLAEWRDLNATRLLREYRNGEGFLYLGRSYRLLLVAVQDKPLRLVAGRFCLRRDLADRWALTAARSAFRRYYVERGRAWLTERVEYFAPKVDAPVRRIDVRELGHRWASYSPAGNVAFHWKCMMAPPQVIDYIVVHELCHAHYRDHSVRFWNEVDKVLPSYRERKEWLKANGASLDV